MHVSIAVDWALDHLKWFERVMVLGEFTRQDFYSGRFLINRVRRVVYDIDRNLPPFDDDRTHAYAGIRRLEENIEWAFDILMKIAGELNYKFGTRDGLASDKGDEGNEGDEEDEYDDETIMDVIITHPPPVDGELY